jgi:hypothetical protein
MLRERREERARHPEDHRVRVEQEDPEDHGLREHEPEPFDHRA